jgi:hypothetical protein
MLTKRAVLIQCIDDYRSILIPYIRGVIRSMDLPYPLNEKEVFKWIVCEELELVYGLFHQGHVHNQYPHSLIHNKLEIHLSASLSEITSTYIKAPKLYSNVNIRVNITNLDLVIEYYTEHSLYHEGVKRYAINGNY